MNYDVKYEYYVRVLEHGGKISYKNSTGSMYLKDRKLFAEFCDETDIVIDRYNIKFGSVPMFFGGNLHVYRIVDGKYQLVKVYTKHFRNDLDVYRKKQECEARFGDVKCILLPTDKSVSLDGIAIGEDC